MIGAALQMLLRGSHYELVERARTIAEANRQIAKLKPDLLLLDVHLPDGSGLEMLRRFTRARARTKVILLTAGLTLANWEPLLKRLPSPRD
jgi:response regulator of citrate/malate metabolism